MHDIPLSQIRPDAITVWEWRSAPVALRDLSLHGGDEDYVALIPPGVDPDPRWAWEGGNFGVCRVQRELLRSGHTVLIGAHA